MSNLNFSKYSISRMFVTCKIKSLAKLCGFTEKKNGHNHTGLICKKLWLTVMYLICILPWAVCSPFLPCKIKYSSFYSSRVHLLGFTAGRFMRNTSDNKEEKLDLMKCGLSRKKKCLPHCKKKRKVKFCSWFTCQVMFHNFFLAFQNIRDIEKDRFFSTIKHILLKGDKNKPFFFLEV